MCIRDRNISSFQINPLDRLSFFSVSPRSSITLRRIILPTSYVQFLERIRAIKEHLRSSTKEEEPIEIIQWDRLANQFGHDSFHDWILASFEDEQNHQQMLFSVFLGGRGTLSAKTAIVWKEKLGSMEDDLYRFFSRGGNDLLNSIDVDLDTLDFSSMTADTLEMDPRPLSRRRRLVRRARNFNFDTLSSTTLDDWNYATFLRDIRKNVFTVDFKIAHRREETLKNTLEKRSYLSRIHPTTTFLTDNYEELELISIDHYQKLSMFRPKFSDAPVSRFNYSGEDTKLSTIHPPDLLTTNIDTLSFKRAIMNLKVFQKLFIISDTLCMVITSGGVLLLDRHDFNDKKHLVGKDNNYRSVKIALYKIGFINDGLVLISYFQQNLLANDYILIFTLVITTITNDIIVLKGSFGLGKRIGTIKVCDRLLVKKQNLHIDKLQIIDYQLSEKDSLQNKRKGSFSDDEIEKRLCL